MGIGLHRRRDRLKMWPQKREKQGMLPTLPWPLDPDWVLSFVRHDTRIIQLIQFFERGRFANEQSVLRVREQTGLERDQCQPQESGAEKQEAAGFRGRNDSVDPQGGVNGAPGIRTGKGPVYWSHVVAVFPNPAGTFKIQKLLALSIDDEGGDFHIDTVAGREQVFPVGGGKRQGVVGK